MEFCENWIREIWRECCVLISVYMNVSVLTSQGVYGFHAAVIEGY